VVTIRSASTADAPQIAAVMRDSWFAGYDGILAPAMIDQATAPDGGAASGSRSGSGPGSG